MSNRLTGLVTPLWALSHKADFGVGDLATLRRFIPWASKAEINFLQLPLIHETIDASQTQSPISALALDPLYLDLYQIPELKSEDLEQKEEPEENNISQARKRKEDLLRIAFDRFFAQLEPDPAFKIFQTQEQSWLSTYSLFRFLMTIEGNNSSWWEWREEYETPRKAFTWLENTLEEHADSIYPEILYYEWLQWQCYKQWREMRDFALSHQVQLMGTLPYHTSVKSADVFFQHENFLPPQAHTPLQAEYNLEYFEKTQYSWWKERLNKYSELFSLCLIDSPASAEYLISLLPRYKDTTFVWSQTPIDAVTNSELFGKENVFPHHKCTEEGHLKDTPLLTEHYPYQSYTTFSIPPNNPVAALWEQYRKESAAPDPEQKQKALKNISLLAQIARIALPEKIRHSLDIPKFDKDIQWGIIDYQLKTNSKFIAITFTDLLNTIRKIKPNHNEESQRLMTPVEDFDQHPALQGLQKEFKLRQKLFRSSPSKRNSSFNI